MDQILLLKHVKKDLKKFLLDRPQMLWYGASDESWLSALDEFFELYLKEKKD